MKNKPWYTFRHCCPILEQTADVYNVGRCWFYLPDGKTCHRHGDVEVEVKYYLETGKCTLENKMRERKGLQLWGKIGEGGLTDPSDRV